MHIGQHVIIANPYGDHCHKTGEIVAATFRVVCVEFDGGSREWFGRAECRPLTQEERFHRAFLTQLDANGLSYQ